VSRIEVQSPQVNIQEGPRLMIIELRKYNEVRELLIEIEPQGCRDMYAIRLEAGEYL